MLAADIQPDRRAVMRQPVDYPVLGERPRGGDVKLRITNISTRGFMANVDGPMRPGERLTVSLPVVGRIEAHLIWTDGHRAGLQLERVVRLGDFTRMFVEMQPPRRMRE